MQQVYFVLCVLTVAVGMAWLFGTAAGRRKDWSAADAFIGVALVPAVIAIVTYILFATLSFALPSRTLMAATPPAVTLLAVGASLLSGGRISWRPDRAGTLAVLSFLVALAPVIWAVYVAATIGQYAHDVSLYLAEASDISLLLRNGTAGWLDWASYAHPAITTPHTKLFQVYLAWGFLFTDEPGFGSDYYPRLLIGMAHLSLICATVGLVGRERLTWGLAAAALLTLNANFISEITGFSRDTFYIAPAVCILALLLRARPGRDTAAWLGLTIALIASLAGHSLGVIVVTAMAIGAGFVQLARYRQDVFRIASFWIVAFALFVAAGLVGAEYVFGDAGVKGFAFPFYVDPFQQDYFRSLQFTSTPNVIELLFVLLRTNGMPVFALALVPLALGIIVVDAWKATGSAREWTGIALSLVTLLSIVAYLPLSMGGTGLAGAFMSNFRYGFSFGVLVFLLVGVSAAIVGKAVLQRLRLPRLAVPAVLLIAAGTTFASGVSMARTVAGGHTERPQQQHDLCEELAAVGVRRILIDNDGMIYRCSLDALYAFTPGGAIVTGADSPAAIEAALAEHQIDAVALTDVIPALWSGTRLYRHLDANWQRVDIDLPQTFLRPGLALPR